MTIVFDKETCPMCGRVIIIEDNVAYNPDDTEHRCEGVHI